MHSLGGYRALLDNAAFRSGLATSLVLAAIVTALTLIIGMVVLFLLSPLLGLITLCASLPLIAVSTLFESRYKVVSRLAQDQEGDLATTVEESVLGIRVLKAFGRGPELLRKFTVQARQLRGTQLRNHAGQVSFPGGRSESHDLSPVETALRETFEETGIASSFVSSVSVMSIHVSGMKVRG